MTIAAVSGQNGGGSTDTDTTTYAFGSDVAANSLIVIVAMQTTNDTDVFVAGDCTKLSGAATIDTVQMDVQNEIVIVGSIELRIGIWSCLVTGAGSLTMEVSNGTNVYSTLIGGHEFSGSWDGTRLEDSASAMNDPDDVSPIDSGSATSAGIALFVGVAGTTDETRPTVTPDAAFTEATEQVSTNPLLNMMYRISTGALTDNATWTINANKGWGGGLAVYKEVAGGGPVTNRTLSDTLVMVDGSPINA